MSRIGKKPIPLPKGVKVNLSGAQLAVEGPKGRLSYVVSQGILVEIKPEEIIITKKEGVEGLDAIFGLSRAHIANLVTGVSAGFQKLLEIVGVGYSAEIKGKDLVLKVGYSHPVVIPAPEGVEFKLEGPTKIVVSGANRQQVGQVASDIRKVKKPEPYKGKGIKYANEEIRRKAGKAAI